MTLDERTSVAMVLQGPGVFEEQVFNVPKTGDDEFVLRTELVTICGGDLIEYQGGNRKAEYPLLMGHELVGTIERIGATAAQRHGVVAGDRVTVEPYLRCGICAACISGDYHFCEAGLTYGVTIPSDREPHLWGAYSQYLYGAPGARVHRVDREVPAAAAALTSVIGNAVRWVRTRGQVKVGERVLVTGLGVQALSSVIVASLAGASEVVVICREAAPSRLALAREYGATAIYNSDEVQRSSALRAELAARKLDVAIECSGADVLYQIAIDALCFGGRLVAAGTRGGLPLQVDLDSVVFKELDIRGGLGQAGDTELAVEIVNSRRFALEKMITHVFPLAEADRALQLCLAANEDVIHVGLDPWAAQLGSSRSSSLFHNA